MADTYKIVWDQTSDRKFEAGVKNGVFYTYNSSTQKYTPGVAWNGLTSISESPDGADAQDLYADNMKYATLRGAENHKGTIEAYTYPDAFIECDGSAELIKGVHVGQQKRKVFGMAYTTMQGSAEDPDFSTEIIHLVYGMTVSPSDRQYETINDSPDAITFSWEYETVPVTVTGMKPTAMVTINVGELSAAQESALKTKLYGSGTTEGELPLPDQLKTLISQASGT